MNESTLLDLLRRIHSQELEPQEGLEQLSHLQYEELEFAKVDHYRELRNGFPEVIYCEGKTSKQIIAIAQAMNRKGSNVLATRLSAEKYQEIANTLSHAVYFSEARLMYLMSHEVVASGQKVAVVSAGTADIPIAEEAAICTELYGNEVLRIYDVGVAGIHRLFNQLEVLRSVQVIIVVAGMEGALASVVGGLVSVPVIAVPTSIGYGAHFGGLSALLSMLNSCASGMAVVNIDNGFGAAYMAATITRQIAKGHL